MNKRARARLIGVTAIILIAIGALLLGVGGSDGAYTLDTVGDISSDSSLVGSRVRVSGAVVPGSWNQRSDPMIFEIRDEGAGSGPTAVVEYGGTVPETFGDNVTAIVTGTLTEDGRIEATDMTVKCPSKYESSTGAMSVEELQSKSGEIVGTPVRVAGKVAEGSIGPAGQGIRFRVSGETEELAVAYDGGLPEEFVDGVEVVLGGSLDESGVFDATSVSLAEASR